MYVIGSKVYVIGSKVYVTGRKVYVMKSRLPLLLLLFLYFLLLLTFQNKYIHIFKYEKKLYSFYKPLPFTMIYSISIRRLANVWQYISLFTTSNSFLFSIPYAQLSSVGRYTATAHGCLIKFFSLLRTHTSFPQHMSNCLLLDDTQPLPMALYISSSFTAFIQIKLYIITSRSLYIYIWLRSANLISVQNTNPFFPLSVKITLRCKQFIFCCPFLQFQSR